MKNDRACGRAYKNTVSRRDKYIYIVMAVRERREMGKNVSPQLKKSHVSGQRMLVSTCIPKDVRERLPI